MTTEQIEKFREDYFTSWKVRKLFVKLYKDCYTYDIKNNRTCPFDQYGFIKSASRYANVDEIEPLYGSLITGLNATIATIRGLVSTIEYPDLMDGKFPHVHWAYHCVNNKNGITNTIMSRSEREYYYVNEARKETCSDFKQYSKVIFPRTYHRKWAGIDFMIQQAEELIKAYGETSVIDKSRRRKIVFFTGSGISKESGIPTFRDSDGLWEQYPVEMVASLSGWYSDPEFLNTFYNTMRLKYTDISGDGEFGINPNGAHRDIIRLAGESQFCDGDNNEIVIITQNVDDLHERALNESLGLPTGYESLFNTDSDDSDTTSSGEYLNGCCDCTSDCDCGCCSSSESESDSESESSDSSDTSETTVTETTVSEHDCPHIDCCDGDNDVCDSDCGCDFYVDRYTSDTTSSESESECPVRIIHLHGELMKMCADGYKEDTRYHVTLPYKKSLTFPVDAKVKDIFPNTSGTTVGNKRMRPYIVFFGEDVPNMITAIQEVENCDAFIIIGTSMQVYPAASLIEHVPYGVPIIYIDPDPQIDKTIYWDVQIIQEMATVGMRTLLNNWNDYVR